MHNVEHQVDEIINNKNNTYITHVLQLHLFSCLEDTEIICFTVFLYNNFTLNYNY